jgi:hypothetical protein
LAFAAASLDLDRDVAAVVPDEARKAEAKRERVNEGLKLPARSRAAFRGDGPKRRSVIRSAFSRPAALASARRASLTL